MFLKEFTGKQLFWSSFFNKVAYLRPATLFKKRLRHMYFSVTFALKHILATFSDTDWSKELFAYIASSIFHFFIFYYWFQAREMKSICRVVQGKYISFDQSTMLYKNSKSSWEEVCSNRVLNWTWALNKWKQLKVSRK